MRLFRYRQLKRKKQFATAYEIYQNGIAYPVGKKMQKRIKRFLSIIFTGCVGFFAAVNILNAESERPVSKNKTDLLQWKMVWAGAAMPYKTDTEIENGVFKAKSLGFNAMGWNSAKPETFVRACQKHEMESYYIIIPKSRVKQKVKPSEQKLPPNPHRGGEPITEEDIGKVIYHNSWIACFSQPDAFESAKKDIQFAMENGYSGIALDFVGYKNYYRCCCPSCRQNFEKYLEHHPGMNSQEAEHRFGEEMMIQFYEKVIAYAKSVKPTIKTTCHIYPAFLPNILYGNRLPVDYCGQTVSWFFKPHWSLGKVKRYTKIVVGDESLYHSGSIRAPFIGFYSKGGFAGDVRTAECVRQEIQIIKKAGARAIQFAFLGHILAVPEVAKVIAEELESEKREK